MASASSATAPPWILRVVPALDSLRTYRLDDLRADGLAGITVAAIAVPQAMAYAMVAGLPAEYGLYTAIVMTAVGAIFDSSRQLINGPTNAISIAVFSTVTGIATDEARIAAIVLLTLLVGAIQIGITLLRMGDLTRYISHSVIVGFTFGAGLLLVLDQLKNLFGLSSVGDAHEHFLVRVARTMRDGGPIHGPTALVGLTSIGLVLALRAIKQRFNWKILPDLLIVVCVTALAVGVLGLDRQGVQVVGEIPAALPGFRVPELDSTAAQALVSPALAIALLGLLEAVSMAKAIAAVTGQKLDMNQQCLSEGLANLSGGFFQCMPGSGSLTRSAINQQAGAVSQWSGVISALAVALIMLLFAPYARFIPRAALAGILIVSAYKMVDWRALAFTVRATRFDLAVVGVTAFSAVAISIEFCVLVGVLMSFLLAVRRAGRMLLTEFVVDAEGGVHERLPEDRPCPKLLIFGLEGELFFGASAALEGHFATIESRITGETRVLVLRLKRALNADAVALATLDQFLDRVKERGVHVLLCGVRAPLAAALDRTGASARLGERIFLEQPVRQTSTLLAIQHAYTLLDARCASCPHRDRGESPTALYYVI